MSPASTLTFQGKPFSLMIDSFWFATANDRPPLRNAIFKITEAYDAYEYFEGAFETISIHPPDNRTVADIVGDDRVDKSPLATAYDSLFVVTAELEDGPNFKAGSALWYYNVVSGQWTLLLETTTYTSLWVSVGVHRLAIPSPSPSPSPSAAPSSSPTSSPSFAARTGGAGGNASGLEGGSTGIGTGGASVQPLPNAGDNGSGNSNTSSSNAGAAVGITILVLTLVFFAGCAGAAYWRHQRLLKARRERLLSLYDKEQSTGTLSDDAVAAVAASSPASSVVAALQECEREEASIDKKDHSSVEPSPPPSKHTLKDLSEGVAAAATLLQSSNLSDTDLLPLEMVEGLLEDLASGSLLPTALSETKDAAGSSSRRAAFSPAPQSSTTTSAAITKANIGQQLSEAKGSLVISEVAKAGILKQLEEAKKIDVNDTKRLSRKELLAALEASVKVAKQLSELPGIQTDASIAKEGGDKTENALAVDGAHKKVAELVNSLKSLLPSEVAEGSSSSPSAAPSLQPRGEHLLGVVLASALKSVRERGAADSKAIERAAYEAGRAEVIGAYNRRKRAVEKALAQAPKEHQRKSASQQPHVIIAAGGRRDTGDRPCLAELERRYGTQAADEAPPAFVPYLRSFVRESAVASLGRLGLMAKDDAGRGKSSPFSVVAPARGQLPSAKALAAHYGQGNENNEAALFALGLHEQRGAFALSNSLLQARAEHLSVAQPAAVAAVATGNAGTPSRRSFVSPSPSVQVRRGSVLDQNKQTALASSSAVKLVPVNTSKRGSAVVVNPLAALTTGSSASSLGKK
jgi:hypothetical protein